MPQNKPGRTYTQDEVNAILARAIERQHTTAGLTAEELEATAREVGISPETLEEATREVIEERGAREEEASIRREKWQRFFRHLRAYLFVNVAMAVLMGVVLHAPLLETVLPMTLGWGIGLFAHFLSTLLSNPARVREKRERVRAAHRERERRREEKRLAKERRKATSQHLEARAEEFGEAVQRGVATFLEVAADKINEQVDAARTRGRKSAPEMPRVSPIVTPPPVVTPPPDAARSGPGRVRVEGAGPTHVRVEDQGRARGRDVPDAEWEDEPASGRARRR